MNQNDNLLENYYKEEETDYKKYIYLLLRQWYWFVIFGILGFGASYVYDKFTKQKYAINTTILVPEKNGGFDMKNIFESSMVGQSTNNLYNQIEIIKSYYTVNQTLKNLNWQTSWYKKELFGWRGIYKQEPFDVIEGQNFVNPRNIAIHIKIISDQTYLVSVEGKINASGAIVDVDFEEDASFNIPFENEYFNFTLFKKAGKPLVKEDAYYFSFNDLNNQTKSYQARFKAELKDKYSDIIQCSIEGEQPIKEGEFLNELISVYVKGKMDFQNEAQWRSLDFINRQLAGFSDSLNSAATEFSKFRSENKIIDLGAEGTMVMDKLKEIESELTVNQRQLDYFQNLLSYMGKEDIEKIVSPSVVGIQDASLNALVLKLGELYNRRQLVSFSAKDNNPALVLIDRELAQTRSRLNENLRNLITNATKAIKSLKEYQASISVQLNRLPAKEQQMINIQRQFDITNEIYTFMLQKRAETNIALASSIPDVQVIDVARPENASPIGLARNKILMMGTMLGLVVPVLFFLLVNYFDNRIRTQEDVENKTKLPILGNIMHSPNSSDLVVSESPKSNIAESFRVLRTNMQFMLSSAQGQVVSIHSTNPAEGKSFTSVNMACILAMNNKKVLLVSADMRKPRLYKIFNTSNDKGLSTYLIGYDTVEQIVMPTEVENLSFIPSGPIPPNPAEILGKPEMIKLLEEVRSRFDFVILDNAPAALVTDGFIVSQLCDLNIFILRYGVSHKFQIEMINQYAEKKMINNIALVVNDVKTNAFGYTYYKYYQYEAYQKAYYNTLRKLDQELN